VGTIRFSVINGRNDLAKLIHAQRAKRKVATSIGLDFSCVWVRRQAIKPIPPLELSRLSTIQRIRFSHPAPIWLPRNPKILSGFPARFFWRIAMPSERVAAARNQR
jgi:hypothetical protein